MADWEKGAPLAQAPVVGGAPAAPAGTEQWLSNPALSGVTHSMATSGPLGLDVIEDPARLPGVLTQAIGSLPKDPDAKARYLAKSLFPNLPEKDALARVGYKDGRLFYQADDNKLYYAEPSFSPMKAPGRTLLSIPNLEAGLLGPSLSTAGAIGGGALTFGAAGGVPGAGAGAAVGEGIRQNLAHWLAGEDVPLKERAMQMGQEAAMGAGGQLGGNLMMKGGEAAANLRNPLRVSGYDLSRVTPQRIADAEANTALARSMGVTVTPGEASNMRSLLFRQRQLGRQEEGATPLVDFYTVRNTQQIPQAWETQVLDRISPVKAPAVGARQLQEGSKGAIKGAVDTRRAQARPLYDAVMQPDNVLSPADFNSLMTNNPLAADALKAVRADPVLSKSIEGMPDASLPVLDLVKRHMDAMWKGAKASPEGANHARIIGGARDDFLTALDNAFPGYDSARAAFEGASPAVDELKKGIVGIAAKDKASGLQNIPRTLFDASSADPLSIASARTAFVKAGKLNEWNAGVRSYLDNLFTAAAKQAQGPAASLWRTIKGDQRQWNNLKAALAPDQLDALDQFMRVAEMVKRAPAEGAATSTDIGSRGAFAGSVSRAVSAGVKGMNPFNIPQAVSNWIIDRSAGRNIGQLVDIITNPDSIRELRKLKMLSPGSKQWGASILNLVNTATAKQLLPGVPDQPLGYLPSSAAAP